MRRALHVVRNSAPDDDAAPDSSTLVEPLPAPVPREPRSLEERAADAAYFDDAPTLMVAPPPSQPTSLMSATSEVRVNTRHLWSVDAGPNVQVDAATTSAPPVTTAPNPDVSWLVGRDAVTRIETPVPGAAVGPAAVPSAPLLNPALPSAPVPTWSEPTGPGVARLRVAELRHSVFVRIAMAVVVVLIALMLLVGSLRKPAPVAAVTTGTRPVAAPSTAPVASAAPSVIAVAPPVVVVAPVAAAATAQASSGGADEVAAVDAVESGDLPRAARLYAALAAAHPTNEAYREAARILLAGSKDSRP